MPHGQSNAPFGNRFRNMNHSNRNSQRRITKSSEAQTKPIGRSFRDRYNQSSDKAKSGLDLMMYHQDQATVNIKSLL